MFQQQSKRLASTGQDGRPSFKLYDPDREIKSRSDVIEFTYASWTHYRSSKLIQTYL